MARRGEGCQRLRDDKRNKPADLEATRCAAKSDTTLPSIQ
jgi:hypothetical protein